MKPAKTTDAVVKESHDEARARLRAMYLALTPEQRAVLEQRFVHGAGEGAGSNAVALMRTR